MKFKINDLSNLIITDDKKEIICMTDKGDLQILKNMIEDYLKEETIKA